MGKKLEILIIILLIFNHSVFAQKKYITKSQALYDIDSLIYKLETTHPDLYATFPEKDFKNSLEEIKISLPDSLSVSDFRKKIAPCIVLLGDGHTNIPFSAIVNKDFVKENKSFFPLQVRINPKDSSIFVKGKNQQILAINEISDKDLISNMIKHSGGETISFRMSFLQRFFPIYLADLYPTEKFHVKIKEGEIISEEILDPTTLKEVANSAQVLSEKNYIYTINHEKSTAILEFNSFIDKDKFEQLLNEMFTEIQEKSIKHLIIDIRHNGGGNSALGDELFQYISPIPFSQFGKINYKISPLSRKADPSLNDKEDGTPIIEMLEENTTPLKEEDLRYTGKVYLLTSNFTFSSASSFAWLFKFLKMGKVVGEETGGLAVTFGDILNFELPESGIPVSVSWRKIYQYGATDENRHGTIPDIEVPADQALKTVLELIDRGT